MAFSISATGSRFFHLHAYPPFLHPPQRCGEETGGTRGQHFPPTTCSHEQAIYRSESIAVLLHSVRGSEANAAVHYGDHQW
jgi:hypothetical protein